MLLALPEHLWGSPEQRKGAPAPRARTGACRHSEEWDKPGLSCFAVTVIKTHEFTRSFQINPVLPAQPLNPAQRCPAEECGSSLCPQTQPWRALLRDLSCCSHRWPGQRRGQCHRGEPPAPSPSPLPHFLRPLHSPTHRGQVHHASRLSGAEPFRENSKSFCRAHPPGHPASAGSHHGHL